MMPLDLIDCASSASLSAWKTRRGCSGLGSIESIGTVRAADSSAGCGAAGEAVLRGGRSEPRPLPSTLREVSVLLMVQDLLGKLDITFRALRAGVIGQNRLPEAGGFR